MFETLEAILIFLWDYILWWPCFMFVAFCITEVILPIKHRKEEEFEKYLE